MTALELTAGWPVDHVSAGWIRADGTDAMIGDGSKPFLLASVTKPLVAFAILVAIEEGSLAMSDAAGPEGSTVEDLLSHSSGLGPTGEVLAGPGERRIYSNYGFDLLGFLLEEATGMSTATYLHEALVLPLGLTSTSLAGSPAHAAISSLDDMVKFCAELLNPTLLSAETIAAMTTPVHPSLTGVLPGYGRQDPNPWGLGVEIRGEKAPHWTGSKNSPVTFGHFGQAGTFIWIDPAAGLACVALTDKPFGPWAVKNWPQFSDAIIDEGQNH